MNPRLTESKLSDYDLELYFPSAFLAGNRSADIDEAISTPEETVFRVPKHPSSPPPVFPRQSRPVLSFLYRITIKQFLSEEAMLKRVRSIIRTPDGQTFELSTDMYHLHDMQLVNGSLQKLARLPGDEIEIGYRADARTQARSVSFPAEQRWDIVRGAVTFPVEVDGARVTCRVSEEALQDYFGATSLDTMVPVFLKHRRKIEDIALRKLRAGDLQDEFVSITTKDFQR